MKRLNARKKKWIERTVSNNRSYKLYLYNRFFIFLILVLLQIVAYVFAIYLIVYDSPLAVVLQTLMFALELAMLLYLINKSERAASKLNWILLILIVPVVGVPGYLLYGEGKPTRRMQKKIARARAEIKAERETAGVKEFPETEGQTRAEGLERFLAYKAGYPAYTGGGVIYYESGEKVFPEILAELEKAEKYVLLDYFIIAHGKMWGEILKRLLKKAEEGVQIRIIYDDFGCMMTLPPKYDRYLEGLHENIRCMTFNNVVPIFAVRMNNRDHRKILVIDGKTAFTGGINLADEYINEKKRFGYWKDTAVKITGNSVCSFVEMFFCMWNAFRKDKESVNAYLPPRNGQNNGDFVIQPYDDSPLDKTSVGEVVYADIIQRAKRYLYIFTPYLILDDFLRTELLLAAARGVDVRIVTPGVPDKKTIYRITRANSAVLMEAGIKIYEYTPGFLHAKSMISDDECGVVGTINLDYRSLYFHFENAVYFTEKNAIAAMKRDAEETFAVSKLCTSENSKRSLFGRLIDSLLRVFETLF
ncbi:MAG: cardiolipin synthase [Clostridia bacterium]|nr:cardiolipin synthase [Clostridia bacterium]